MGEKKSQFSNCLRFIAKNDCFPGKLCIHSQNIVYFQNFLAIFIHFGQKRSVETPYVHCGVFHKVFKCIKNAIKTYFITEPIKMMQFGKKSLIYFLFVYKAHLKTARVDQSAVKVTLNTKIQYIIYIQADRNPDYESNRRKIKFPIKLIPPKSR